MIDRSLKVWGGLARVKERRGDVRVLVCNTTKKRAVEILNRHGWVSANYFNDHFCLTGNKAEIAICTTEGVWASQSVDGRVFTKLMEV